MENVGKYLVYVDGSESSQVALNFACKKAERSGGVVEILHIIPPADMQNLFGVAEKMREERWQEGEVLVKSMVDSATKYAGIIPAVQIREGRVREEIINATLRDNTVSMLVIGTSTESAERVELINWLTGKLGDRLLVPMMIVPGNLTDLQIDELS